MGQPVEVRVFSTAPFNFQDIVIAVFFSAKPRTGKPGAGTGCSNPVLVELVDRAFREAPAIDGSGVKRSHCAAAPAEDGFQLCNRRTGIGSTGCTNFPDAVRSWTSRRSPFGTPYGSRKDAGFEASTIMRNISIWRWCFLPDLTHSSPSAVRCPQASRNIAVARSNNLSLGGRGPNIRATSLSIGSWGLELS